MENKESTKQNQKKKKPPRTNKQVQQVPRIQDQRKTYEVMHAHPQNAFFGFLSHLE